MLPGGRRSLSTWIMERDGTVRNALFMNSSASDAWEGKEHMSRTAFRRWRTVASVAAAAAVVAVAGPLPAALADVASSPSLTANDGAANIAVQGPDDSLVFYWADNGSTAWQTDTVAGAGTTFGSPAMAVNGGTVDIAAEGPDNTLLFYWAYSGSPSAWHMETVGGANSVYSLSNTPSIVINGDTVNIAVTGPNRSLSFYWAYTGTGTWHAETVPAPDVTSAPSITVDGNTFYIAVVEDGGQLWVWTAVIGTGTWKGKQIGLSAFSYFPAITANGGNVDIVAPNQVNGSLDFYSAAVGSSSWNSETVASAGSTLIVPASITVNEGTITIAAVGGTVADSQLLFYSAASGSSTWGKPEPVAGGVSNSAAPSITANDGAANISDVTSAGDLEFYWAADGSSAWQAEPVPGNGTGTTA